MVNVSNKDGSIIIDAKDEGVGLSVNPYSLDGKNWEKSNNIKVYKGGEYTVYVKDKLGNTTTKTVQVTSISQSDDKKDDGNKVEDNKTDDNGTGGNNNYSGKTDGTESPDTIPQAGVTFSIAILIVTLISAYVGYRKFRKINY